MTSNRFFDLGAVAAAALLFSACAAETTGTSVTSVAAPTELVRSSALAEMRFASGTVRSNTVSPLSSKVMGNVMRVHVVEGQRVRAGQLLVEIDAREAEARAAQATAGGREVEESTASAAAAVVAAEANATLANTTLKRYEVLRQRNSVSGQEFDEVAARARAADAALQQAVRAHRALIARGSQSRAASSEAATFVSYTALRSPIDGIVTARMIDPGAQAVPGMPLVTVEDDSSYRVESTVPEELAGSIAPGHRVEITVAGRTLTGIVARVVPAVDAATRSALVKIDVPRDAALRSGAFARVAFPAGTRSGIAVPSSALVRRGQLTSVFIVDNDGMARMRLVTLGGTQGGQIEVLSGLDPGERFVRQVVPSLRDGVRITGARS